jgi:glycosyltransferase involved in cell wall biosynthesis
MKVFQLLCGRTWGGGSVVVLAITRAMIARGDEVYVFSFDPESDRRFREAGAKLVRPPFWLQAINPLDAFILFSLWRVCRKERFDLVATHTSKGGFLGRVAARMAGVPSIVHHAHGFSFNRPLGGLARRLFIALERVAARAGDLIISVNDEQRRTAIECGVDTPARIGTIHNGIDLLPFSGSNRETARRQLGFGSSAVLIGTIGRLAPQKGFAHLIRAFRMVLERTPSARLVIAGDGPLEAELHQEAKSLGIADRVCFTGFRRDVPDLLAAFDIFVQPSLWEGLSISLIEALAAGKPIVATDIESSREILVPGENGLLVAPADETALARAIEQLTLNPGLAERLATNARRAAAVRFSEQRMVEQVLAAYDRVARSERAAATGWSVASRGRGGAKEVPDMACMAAKPAPPEAVASETPARIAK